VVDASRVLAGPYLAMLLGDLGADVVKVERPGGDQTRGWGPPFVGRGRRRTSAYFVSANRGKRSIVLDLKQPGARAAFARLVERADVLVENFLPGEWRRLGFRGGDFTRRHRRLVQVTISGYGAADPDRPAYDLVLQAETGLMSLTGFERGEPVRVGVAIVDILAALWGLAGTLAALGTRAASGRGGRVEVPMVEAGTAFLAYAAQSWLADGRQPPRLGSRHPNLAPYQALRARDGWLVVAAGGEDHWLRLCAALGVPALGRDPRFATNASRVRHRPALDRALARAVTRRGVGAWMRRLRRAGVPAGRLNGVGAAVRAGLRRGQVVRLPAGAYGSLPAVAAPLFFAGRRPDLGASPPAPGEHTAEVLAEVGFARREIERLGRSGAAAGQPRVGGASRAAPGRGRPAGGSPRAGRTPRGGALRDVARSRRRR
jgi:crotonobetainyl-CoA:carnitine CoA-transferase CaiB-like acyl-CoA transferase